MLLDIILLIKNLQKKFVKFLKSNLNKFLNKNNDKNLKIKILNRLFTLFILY